MILGVGVGSLREEFDLLGAPFDDRGARGDDALRALRAALPTNEPAYEGEFYSFSGLTVDPCALQAHMPIWVGGRTQRSLRRALTLADGWCPFGVSIDTAAQWLKARDVPAGFEVVLPPEKPLDPVEKPEATQEVLEAMAVAGTTTVFANFIHNSLEHYLAGPRTGRTARSEWTAGMTLLPPLTADEWGDDEYDAVGALFGMPGEDVPRAGSGDARDPTNFDILGVLARHPKMAREFLTYNAFLLQRGELPLRLRELAVLRLAHARRSVFFWGEHVRVAKAGGLSEEDIAGIAAGNNGFDGVDRLVLETTDELLTARARAT